MTIIRECVTPESLPGFKNSRGVLRSRTYSHSLHYLLLLFSEASKDFPQLTAADCEVVLYAGDRYAQTMGIEFTLPADTVFPDTYTRIGRGEPTA